jgi:DNA-binding transcriptional ArsR family regulator
MSFLKSGRHCPHGNRTDKNGAEMVSAKLIADTEAAATFLTLMGNEKRLAIMGHLVDDELSVGAIAERVDLSQSALSQHLAKLRGLGLVQTRRDRQMIYYSCHSEAVRRLLTLLAAIFDSDNTEIEAERPRLRRTGT